VTVAQAGQLLGRIATPLALRQAQVFALVGVVAPAIAGAQQVTAASSLSGGLALVGQKQQITAVLGPARRRLRRHNQR
jgi:hypothetical protein